MTPPIDGELDRGRRGARHAGVHAARAGARRAGRRARRRLRARRDALSRARGHAAVRRRRRRRRRWRACCRQAAGAAVARASRACRAIWSPIVEKAMARDPATALPDGEGAGRRSGALPGGPAGRRTLLADGDDAPLHEAASRALRRRGRALLTALAMTGAWPYRASRRSAIAQGRAGRARAGAAQAEKRSSELMLSQAAPSLDDEIPPRPSPGSSGVPTRAIARAAQAIFADALSRGVADARLVRRVAAQFVPDGRLAMSGVNGDRAAVERRRGSGQAGHSATARACARSLRPERRAAMVIQRIDETLDAVGRKDALDEAAAPARAGYDRMRPFGRTAVARRRRERRLDRSVVDARRRAEAARRRAHARLTLAFLKDGRLAVGGQDHHVRIYDLESGARARRRHASGAGGCAYTRLPMGAGWCRRIRSTSRSSGTSRRARRASSSGAPSRAAWCRSSRPTGRWRSRSAAARWCSSIRRRA